MSIPPAPNQCPSVLNLILKILIVPHQPLMTSEKCGYFFFYIFSMVALDGHLNKSIKEWSEA
jgi:hypothetical protein